MSSASTLSGLACALSRLGKKRGVSSGASHIYSPDRLCRCPSGVLTLGTFIQVDMGDTIHL